MKEELLLTYLKANCLGRKNIQRRSQIGRALHIGKNELTRLVHRLRVRGEPVASSWSGYFYAVNAGEVFSTIKMLEKMIATLTKSIEGLKKALEGFGPIAPDGGGASG